jgi:hypothetical protein
MKRRWRWSVGALLLGLNVTLIAWRTAHDTPPPEVVRVPTGTAPSSAADEAAPAWLANADRPYFGLLDYRPRPEAATVAALDGALFETLDLLCERSADDLGPAELPDLGPTQTVAAPALFPQLDGPRPGGVVAALLLVGTQGDMPPLTFPPNPTTSAEPPKEPLVPRPAGPQGPAPEASAGAGAAAPGFPAPPFAGAECYAPPMSPPFPCEMMGGGCWYPCPEDTCQRKSLWKRICGWFHRAPKNECCWPGCCPPCYGCCETVCDASFCCQPPPKRRWFNFFRRHKDEGPAYPCFCCCPAPIMFEGQVPCCGGW